jgi:putative ABC transport system permease protein
MFQNYLKVAWRNLLKNKTQSVINIAGLSVGMAVTLLIGLWIYDEVTFDAQNPGYGRIAKVIQNVSMNGEIQTWNSTPYPLANDLREHYGSDFTRVVLSTGIGTNMLGYADKKINVKGSFFEPAGADLLDLHMLSGTRGDLAGPHPIFLSASTAKAFFGDVDPMGKTLRVDNNYDVRVAGVYEDLPRNSSFADLGFVSSWQTYYETTQWIKTIQDPWRPNAFDTYVQLGEHADVAAVNAKIRDAKLRMVNPRLARMKPQLFLYPMSQWYLHSDFKDGHNTGGRIQYVWMFGIIGLFVLLLACINFMNMSTARSEKRAREVGIRKAIGSERGQLIYQFFSESILVTLMSFLLALAWVQLSLPAFNEVSSKSMSIPWGHPLFWVISLGACLITGLLAGSYPALYLSSFRPIKVLKGGFKAGPRAALPRKILVVLQFTVSVVLIIGTLVVYLQIQFARNRPIGFNRSGLVSVVTGTPDVFKHLDAFRQDLLNDGSIQSLAEGDGGPIGIYGSTSGINWPGKDPNQTPVVINMNVSRDYGKTVAWQVIEGRDFSKDFPSDTSALVVNEAAVHLMGLRHPIGVTITSENQPFRIIGVVNDIVAGSPYEEVQPSVYFLSDSALSAVVLRLNPNQSAATSIAAIGQVFKKYDPNEPFSFTFTDDDYAQKFDSEQRIGRLAGFFASLAIFICCLGLFGMSAFMAEQRTKEIGVRKVLGASVANLWGLLSRDFIFLVFLSLCIAVPLAWVFMHRWLQHYTYHASLTWWSFALPCIGALAITMVTVSFQSVRAAMANPIKSLRTE